MLTFKEFLNLIDDGVLNYGDTVVSTYYPVGNTCVIELKDSVTGAVDKLIAYLYNDKIVFLPIRERQRVFSAFDLRKDFFLKYFNNRFWNNSRVYYEEYSQIIDCCEDDKEFEILQKYFEIVFPDWEAENEEEYIHFEYNLAPSNKPTVSVPEGIDIFEIIEELRDVDRHLLNTLGYRKHFQLFYTLGLSDKVFRHNNVWNYITFPSREALSPVLQEVLDKYEYLYGQTVQMYENCSC